MDVGVSSSTYSIALTGRKVDELLAPGKELNTRGTVLMMEEESWEPFDDICLLLHARDTCRALVEGDPLVCHAGYN